MPRFSSIALRTLPLLAIALLCACSQPPQPKVTPDSASNKNTASQPPLANDHPAAHLQHSLEASKAVAQTLEDQARQQRQAIEESTSTRTEN